MMKWYGFGRTPDSFKKVPGAAEEEPGLIMVNMGQKKNYDHDHKYYHEYCDSLVIPSLNIFKLS